MKPLFSLALSFLMLSSLCALSFAEPLHSDLPSPPYFFSDPAVEATEPAANVSGVTFEDYLSDLILQSRSRLTSRESRNVGARLQGNNRKLYDLMRADIEKLAAGEAIYPCFEYPYSEFLEKTEYSITEDLNMEPVLTTEGFNEPFAVVSERANRELGISFSLVMDCLRADLPYAMYWEDKTRSAIASSGVPLTVEYKPDPNGIFGDEDGNLVSQYIVIPGSFTAILQVTDAYRGTKTKTASIGQAYTVESVDPVRGQTARNAMERASQIVKRAEGLTDLEKLRFYHQRIIDLVDYNHPAADNDDTPYGDPWQLIWVFDDDPETKVVCEGYSKAFQYLCDLTHFSRGISVICPTGYLQGSDATGAGRHMWNIVKMDDGKNYMVDVTNSDYAGVEFDLFLAKYARKVPASDGSDRFWYTYRRGNSELYYMYDDDLTETYLAGELEISDTDYEEPEIIIPFDAYVPDGTTRIEDEAFYGDSFTAIFIPESVTYIGHHAFAGNTHLLRLCIENPECVVEDDFVDGCTSLTGRYFEAPEAIRKRFFPDD